MFIYDFGFYFNMCDSLDISIEITLAAQTGMSPIGKEILYQTPRRDMIWLILKKKVNDSESTR